jgi:hypothetical protein
VFIALFTAAPNGTLTRERWILSTPSQSLSLKRNRVHSCWKQLSLPVSRLELYCDVINNANTLVATSTVMRAQLIQQCNYNIVRILRTTMYKSFNFLELPVVDCGLRSESIVGASEVRFFVLQIGHCTLRSWVRVGRLSQTVVVSCGVLSWSAE